MICFMLTHRRIDEETNVTMLIIRFPSSLLHFNETWNFYRDFRKFTKHFSINCLVCRNRQREGRVLWIEFQNMVRRYRSAAHLQKACEITYHISVCQVNRVSIVCNSLFIHSSMQLGWGWIVFLSTPEQFVFVQFA